MHKNSKKSDFLNISGIQLAALKLFAVQNFAPNKY